MPHILRDGDAVSGQQAPGPEGFRVKSGQRRRKCSPMCLHRFRFAPGRTAIDSETRFHRINGS